MEYVTLNNGIKMPVLGYGVFQVTGEECERGVSEAIGAGYRLIDTAQSYGNEEAVGRAVEKCGVPREELFLTTKVWITNGGYEKAKESLHESVRKLRTEYIDLVLIHQPFNDYYGAYNDGFFNAYIGQRGVTRTTADYNYIAMNDDVYVYTGVTSVNSDQSNIGFLLVNQRTKEAKFYPVSGATEQSAQASAQGAVEDLGYRATFPILLNINNQPTYFMSLKDSSGLVKMYGQRGQLPASGRGGDRGGV